MLSYETDGISRHILDAHPRPATGLILRRCTRCARVRGLTGGCPSCRATVAEVIQASGAATIVSWRPHDRVQRGLATSEPTMIAIVELAEGPWIFARLDVKVPILLGQRTPVRFVPESTSDEFPLFR